MERARAGGVRLALCLGGNLYGSNPDANFAAEALNTIDMVVYLSTTLNTGHAWGTGRETLILPVRARDEEAQSTTQESMFNFVRLSEGGPPRVPGVRSEVEVIAGIAESYFSGRSPVDWKGLREHREIRRAIAQIIPGYEEIGRIDESKREFHVGGRILREPKFPTPSGRARLHLVERPAPFATGANELRLMTIRSEGQFNTVVYEEEDFYRGQDRRDVILMNERDIARLGLRTEERVTVRSATGALKNVIVRPFDIREGNAAMYYPEANVLVPRSADRDSGTPRFKSVAVKIEAE